MGLWLTELRRNLPADIVLHVVGTKADIVAKDPSKREVPFERCIAYVAENLAPGMGSTPPPTATPMGLPGAMSDWRSSGILAGPAAQSTEPRSPSSKRSSGFWGQEVGWDACHEISAESGEGVEEVFRVGRDRRSWLFSPQTFSPAVTVDQSGNPDQGQDPTGKQRRRCC